MALDQAPRDGASGEDTSTPVRPSSAGNSHTKLATNTIATRLTSCQSKRRRFSGGAPGVLGERRRGRLPN
ncbi:hypothetical protein AUC69_08600 [Methyloceanibacter superfactus]|uniref:Uncharacterized protein n=1 Tax=Methyloceanibacter superfactus TaxID=1774969 RepID=A0A1E3W1Q0_9HYPH|nr:hypothetical protein [Methyloceanibacter superfactus]ODR99669.1 hypothetical protein AUC69_08600 [Methyloceanibacter superfactus]